jgi:hypothetical protein
MGMPSSPVPRAGCTARMSGRGAHRVGLVFDFVFSRDLCDQRAVVSRHSKHPTKFRSPDGVPHRVSASGYCQQRNHDHAVRHQMRPVPRRCRGRPLGGGFSTACVYPKAMPLSAFEAVADAAAPPRPASPVELPWRRKQGNHPGADREREFDCLAVNLFSRAVTRMDWRIRDFPSARVTSQGLRRSPHRRVAGKPL